MEGDGLAGEVRETEHRYGDDLLSAGLGLAGLRSPHKPAFSDPRHPRPAELRRRAMHTAWRAIADLSPMGGFGRLYGRLPRVPGREYQSFARLPGASAPHRVLLQAPDDFDRRTRCLVVTASPGSHGIYGGLALAGAWGLPRGFAVAYTDKGAGTGYFDAESELGVRLDGTRARAGDAPLEFEPADGAAGVGVKHAHSGDNPEARWGEYVLQAVEFGLAMLERAYPADAPFRADNTLIVAVGLSNGGAAVLQAAGRDAGAVLDGVVSVSPNVYASAGGRALYDYASEASLLLSSALAAPPLRDIVQARYGGAPAPFDFVAHGAALREAGILGADRPAAWPGEALERLIAAGWTPEALQAAALINELELWRPIGATYASAYLRRSAADMPCEAAFEALTPDADGVLRRTDDALRAAWWSDGHGIPTDAGVTLAASRAGGTPLVEDFLCLRSLWDGGGAESEALRDAVAATAARLPRASLPLWIVHGRDDGLIPIHFSADRYVDWLRASNREAVYWRVPHAQHFDALLGHAEIAARYLPMMPYAYAALDGMLRHLRGGAPLPASRTLDSRPRGEAVLEHGHLGIVAA